MGVGKATEGEGAAVGEKILNRQVLYRDCWLYKKYCCNNIIVTCIIHHTHHSFVARCTHARSSERRGDIHIDLTESGSGGRMRGRGCGDFLLCCA